MMDGDVGTTMMYRDVPAAMLGSCGTRGKQQSCRRDSQNSSICESVPVHDDASFPSASSPTLVPLFQLP
jgi:hypothetical protein